MPDIEIIKFEIKKFLRVKIEIFKSSDKFYFTYNV